MHPTSSFLSKCATVLIGVALSWATVTNPHADQVARHFLGSDQVGEPEASEMKLASDPLLDSQDSFSLSPTPDEGLAVAAYDASKKAGPTPAKAMDEQQRIDQISGMLRELGATYLRLEKHSKLDGIWYRVRCDLASESKPVKCCLEATRKSAVAAMEDVLQAARLGIDNPRKIVAAVQ